jgi:acyl dehydratase
MATRVKAGDVLSWERTFTVEDVRAFGRLSGDLGRHHVEPDAQGRLMVQGLFTASLVTKLGGDLDYIAREMTFEFLRPVFTGDTVRCTLTITDAVEEAGRLRARGAVVCVNQHGKEVLRASSDGIIR